VLKFPIFKREGGQAQFNKKKKKIFEKTQQLEKKGEDIQNNGSNL